MAKTLPPTLPEPVRTALLDAMTAIPLPAERAASLRARLMQRTGGQIKVVPATAGQYTQLADGIEVRPLRVDMAAGTHTSLVRLAPGAALPEHGHGAEEECLVLEGAVLCDGQRHSAGDYMLAPAGSQHREMVSDGGVLLLIRGELSPVLRSVYAALPG